jgi:hypothetical protein
MKNMIDNLNNNGKMNNSLVTTVTTKATNAGKGGSRKK